MRILVGCVFRLAIRAFVTSQRGLDAEIDVAPSHVQTQRVLAGAAADLLLVGDIDLARRVALPGLPAQMVASDPLMAAGRAEIGLTDRNLLDRLLDDQIRVVICQPGRHANGDLAMQLFDRADAIQPGAGLRLRAKASPTLATRGKGADWGPRRVMDVLNTGEADLVLASRSAIRTLSAVATLVAPPPELATHLVCGLAILATHPTRQAQAQHFANTLLTQAGQAILARHGFDEAGVWPEGRT